MATMQTIRRRYCSLNGNVLFAGTSDALYEFNGTSLTRTVNPPATPSGSLPAAASERPGAGPDAWKDAVG